MPRVIRTHLKRTNLVFTTANSAYDRANNSLANTGGQLTLNTSSLVIPANISATGNIVSSANVVASGYSQAQYFVGYGTGFSNALLVTTVGSGTWSVPSGVQRFKITMVGGGGGGGGTAAANGHSGSGGGGGGVTIKYYNTVGGVTTLNYNVGAGGTAGSAGGAGGAGANSNTNYSSTWAFANGGTGGGASAVGFVAGGSGGPAFGGDISLNGFSGNAGGFANSNTSVIARGAMVPLGWGGGGSHPDNAAGGAGEGYGGGGGGGRTGGGTTGRGGGAGAQGVILIEW